MLLKCVCVSSSSFFLREKECAWDLLLKEEGGCLGVVLSTQVCLIDWKGRAPVDQGFAPVDQGAPKGKWHSWELNLLIQHTGSRWCSSNCVHEGCGGVDRWLQTEDQALQDFLYRQPSRQASTTCPLPCAETAELLDAVFSTAGSFHELM